MLTMLATLILSAPAPAVQPPGVPSPEPVLVAKGKGFLIHAVTLGSEPAQPKTPPLVAFQTAALSQGVAIFHTDTETGKMKALMTSGMLVRQSPPMGIDRLYYTATRVAGIAADTERLYVLVSVRKKTAMLQARPMENPDFEPATYHLAVLSLADGEALHVLPMKEGDFPKELPAETVKPGPVELKENGVACFGVTFTFKGQGLLEQRYEKK
jgi:hypothetical protein